MQKKNNSAETSVLIFLTSGHDIFFEKLKIVEKELRKRNSFYGKVSLTLNIESAIFSFRVFNIFSVKEPK